MARTAAPLVVDLTLSGSALVAQAPAALPDLFAGAPATLSLAAPPRGGRRSWCRAGPPGAPGARWCPCAPCAPGEGRRAAIRRYARERIEDLETRVAAGEGQHDPEIERLGLAFQVATRLTSWIAVSEEPTVDPGAPTRRERMPQQLPHGMSVEGLGLRSAARSRRPPSAAMAVRGGRPRMFDRDAVVFSGSPASGGIGFDSDEAFEDREED